MFKKSVLGIVLLGIVACSNKPRVILPESEKINVKDNSEIQLLYAIQDGQLRPNGSKEKLEKLRVITRGDSAGKAIVNGVFGGILCNPFSLLSCSWGDLGFSKEQLTGTQTNVENISKSYAYPKYKELLKQNLSFSSANSYSNVPIYFLPNENYLVYDGDFYKLVVGFSIYVDKYYNSQVFMCHEEKSGISYDKWVDKNYSLAISEGKKLVEKCFEKLDKEYFENLKQQIETQKQNFL